jgi:hypothetical protein
VRAGSAAVNSFNEAIRASESSIEVDFGSLTGFDAGQLQYDRESEQSTS